MAYEKTWQFDTNRAYSPTSLTDMAKYFLWYWKSFLTGQLGVSGTQPTVITAATPSASGGTLASGTYYYRVTAIVGGVESVGSNEFAVTVTGPSGSVALTWLAVPSATGYNVYRGISSGGENVYYAPGNVTSYTDTNAASSGGSPRTDKGTWWLVGSSNGTNADNFSSTSFGHDYFAVNNTTGPTWLTLPVSWNAASAPSTNFVRATAGSPHSWMVFRAPASVGNSKLYYLLVDWSTSSDYQVNITLGVDVAPTGGSNTTAPTMNCLQGGATTTVAGSLLTNATFAMSSNNGPVHVNASLATDGSFNILTSRDGTGKYISGFLGHLPANQKAVEQYPLWISLSGDASVSSGFGSTTGIEATSTCIMRAPDSSIGGNWAVVIPVTTYLPNVADTFDGSFVSWPLWLATSAAYRSIRGRLQDITYFGGGASTGSVDNPSGSPSYVVVGNYWFPCNAAPIL